jgi:uncharacterized protein
MKRYTAPPSGWDCGVSLSRIRKTGESHEEKFELSAEGSVEHWGQSYVFTAPVTARVRTDCTGDRIFAVVSVSAKFSLPCCRCLEDTGLAIDGDLRYLFTLRPQHAAGVPGKDEENDDIDVIPIDGFETAIDFTPYIWEVMLLLLPERVLCRDDCRGLCHVCGKNLNDGACDCKEDNIDPRLAVLKEKLI